MKQFNYRLTVNINQKVMNLGLRCRLPEEMEGKKIRVQAVFSQRLVERRFPMEVHIRNEEMGRMIMADAAIELPYVFYRPPKNKVDIIFSLWCETEEYILDNQPFPVQKDMFLRQEQPEKKSLLKFGLCTAGLPLIIAKEYASGGHNLSLAKKQANAFVYHTSGYTYSPRQRNTDYFNEQYNRFVKKTPSLSGKKILFLSERLPEEGGNLLCVKKELSKRPDLEINEFIITRTVDLLKKKELKECARLCAQSDVIILEDFYPQLHRLTIRPETKVVQLWHACGAFKTFGLTRMGKQGGAPQSSMNHRNYNLVTVSSEKIRGIYAEAFALPVNKVKALGVPRTDIFFDPAYMEEKRKLLYEKYPVLTDHKVVLFAPTFRGDGNKDAYYPAEAFDVNLFMEKMRDDVVCIVKHHPFVKQEFFVDEKWKDRVLDLTGKDLINDLMFVSDLLITDYSSSVFEAMLAKLPVLFYAFDEEEYMRDRDFYYSYENFVPGLIERDFDSMAKTADSLLYDDPDIRERTDEVKKKEAAFKESFLSALDGHSTQRICRHILEMTEKRENVTRKRRSSL